MDSDQNPPSTSEIGSPFSDRVESTDESMHTRELSRNNVDMDRLHEDLKRETNQSYDKEGKDENIVNDDDADIPSGLEQQNRDKSSNAIPDDVFRMIRIRAGRSEYSPPQPVRIESRRSQYAAKQEQYEERRQNWVSDMQFPRAKPPDLLPVYEGDSPPRKRRRRTRYSKRKLKGN